MSQENVEIVRRIYASLDLSQPGSATTARVPAEPFGTLIDPKIEWLGPRDLPDLAEAHYGHEGVERYLAKVGWGTRCQDDPDLKQTASSIPAFRTELQSIYSDIAAAAGAASRVWVIAYPRIFAEKFCRGANQVIGVGEQHFLNQATLALNAVAASASHSAGVHFVGTGGAFKEHQVCNGDSYFNGIVPLHPEYSFHPNAAGQRLYASWVRDHIQVSP
jgi:hypothetical protein